MTFLSEYLADKSINIAEVSRKTGVQKSCRSHLNNKENSNLKTEKLFLNSKVINSYPTEILEKIFGHLKLNK